MYNLSIHLLRGQLMQATIVDLRYKTNDILKALSRNEEVHILYHGKECGIIIPPRQPKKKISIKDLPFFGMSKEEPLTVKEEMRKIRRGRYSDI